MAQLFRNNAVTTLAAQLNAGATSMTLTDAASFPDPGADFYLATLVSVNGSGQETAWEIVRVTAKAGSTLTVTRAQESTADVTWPAGTPVQMRLTAGSMDGKANATHTHVIADTTGLQAALDGKAATSHSHAIADVTGLQTTLDGKQATLVSGTSIKTVNGSSLLGSGNLAVGDVTLAGTQTLTDKTLTTPVLSGTASGTTAGRLGYASGVLSFGNGTNQRSVFTLEDNQTVSSTNVFGHASGQTFLASTTTTQDGITVVGRAGGSSTRRVTLAPGTLTANRAVTFGDFAGTVVLDTATQTLTNKTLTAPVIGGQAAVSGALYYSAGDLGFFNGSTYLSLVTTTGAQALNNKSLSSPTLADAVDVTGSMRGTITAVGALNIDCSLGNYFTKTINGAGTFTVSNVPASRVYAFTLELTHTSGVVTWFSGVEWPGGTAPSLTTGKTHLFTFVTDDGGTRWRGVANTNYTN